MRATSPATLPVPSGTRVARYASRQVRAHGVLGDVAAVDDAHELACP